MSDPSVGRRYQGLTAQERTARRRAAILAAALELFGTTGYQANSVKQLCRASALTERYFYESFADREDCLAALYDDLIGDLREATSAAVQEARDPDDAAAAGLTAFVRNLTGDPRRARVVLIEVVGVSEAMERRRHTVLREFSELTVRTWSRGADRMPPQARLTATALVGGVNHLLVDWLMDGRRTDPDTLAQVCTGLFTAARRAAED